MNSVYFFNNDRQPALKNKRRLKAFILELFQTERKTLRSISFVFCSDEYLLDINREFLDHDFYTDVIGFDLALSENEIEAEVYISFDRVKENAKKERKTVDNELHRVIFHGSLHFCGYSDKKKKDQEEMRKAENKYINKYFNI
jgi:probable rRNA maturation factor